MKYFINHHLKRIVNTIDEAEYGYIPLNCIDAQLIANVLGYELILY